VVAADNFAPRLRDVSDLAYRLRLNSVRTLMMDATDCVTRPNESVDWDVDLRRNSRTLPRAFPRGSFDRVLADVPCSGSGSSFVFFFLFFFSFQRRRIERGMNGMNDAKKRFLLILPIPGQRPVLTSWLNPKFLAAIETTQSRILANALRLVKPGGTVVYSTCSIFRQENQDRVRRVVEREMGAGMDVQVVEERVWLPHVDGTVGFYAAKLVKNSG
jgi:16S rRNA C967 or C1407 C5-methylase (RsmB/RsmF family)